MHEDSNIMNLSKSYLYVPIETWSREFHSKLLVALEAIKSDWTVIFGPKTEMQRWLFKLPQGVVLQFGYHKNFHAQYEKLRKYGHKVASIDEEGLVTLNPEFYRRYRVSEKTLSECDICFAWGNKHAEMLKSSAPEYEERIKIVGNPRIDLCRAEFRKSIEKEADKIRKKYDKFILINGNFGSFNHSKGIGYTWDSLESKGWLDTSADRQYHEVRIALQGTIFNNFKELIPFLVEHTSLNIVVRPHPSESLTPWLKISEKYDERVIVKRSGNVLPWIMASEVLLHNGCTTAVEAFVLNKPAISYRPETSVEHEAALPHAVSNQAMSKNEVLDIMKNVIPIHQSKYEKRLSDLGDYIGFINESFSHVKIVEELNHIKLFTNEVVSNFNIHYIVNELRHYVARIIYRKRYSYVLGKCHSLNKNTIIDEIGEMKLDSCLNLLNIRNICGRLVLLEINK